VKVVIAGALFQCLSSPCIHAKGEMGISYHLEIGSQEPKISRTPKVSSLIDLILAMTVSFASMTLTLHKRRIHCSGITQWWLMGLQLTKSAALPAEAGCETGRG